MKLLGKKKEQQNRPKITDVFFRTKDKVVSLQKKVFLVRINVDELKRLFNKNIKFFKYTALFLVVLFFVIFSLNSRADVADFYPTSCLGSWENPKYAEGVPEVKDNARRNEFSALNSAVLNNTNGQLYCGGFSGEIPKDVLPKKFVLKFSVIVSDELLSSPAKDIPTDKTISKNIIPVAFAQDVLPNESQNTDAALVSPPINTDENTNTIIPSDQTGETSVDISSASTENGNPETNSGDTSAVGDDTVINDTTNATIEENPTKENDFSGNVNINDTNDYLKVSYTLDGQNWNSLGMINAVNISNPSFEIPLENVNWEEVSKVQISLTPILSIDKQKIIYLDGMWIESEYAKAEDIKALPKISLENSSLDIIEGKADFSTTEDPVFNIADPDLSNYQVAKLVSEKKAELIEDKDMVLNGMAGIKEKDNNIVEIVTPPSFNGGILKSVEDTLTNIFSPEDTGKLDTSPISPPDDTTNNPPLIDNVNVTEKINEIINPEPSSESPKIEPLSESPVIENKENTSDSNTVTGGNITSFLFAKNVLAESIGISKITEAIVLDVKGNKTDISTNIEKITKDGQEISQVKINKPTRELKPGKYTLHVTLETDTVIIETSQDFNWGVLVVNTDKSIYSLGDKANLEMGVLDDEGHTICAAALDMEIKSPSGVVTNFSTEMGGASSVIKIIKDSVCGPDNIVLNSVPDYRTIFEATNEVGEYKIKLTAQTANGIKIINDKFKVEDGPLFSIRRVTASRIQPTANYSVSIYVTPKEDFKGIIIEQVPVDFNILPPKKSIKYSNVDSVGTEKIISWNVDLKKGQEKVLGYIYDAPNRSPDMFLLGPLQSFSSLGSWSQGSLPDFQELRKWQIASDAVCNTTGSSFWSDSSIWSGCTGAGGLPDPTDDVTITSGTYVTLDMVTPKVNSLTIEGTLDTDSLNSYDLNSNNIILNSGGVLEANASNIYLWSKTGTLIQNNGGTFNTGTSEVFASGDNSSGEMVWTDQTNSGTYNWRSITSSADGTMLAAVVDGDYVYTSTDSGVTWTKQTNSPQLTWTSITSSADGTKLAAVANGDYIYTSTDSGVNWIQQTNSPQRAWTSITSSADGTKLAVVANSDYVYTSTDSGVNWTQQTNSPSTSWRSIISSTDGTMLAAVADVDYIYTSTDSGASWTTQWNSGVRHWTSITSSSDGIRLVAVADGDWILASTDSGVTWNALWNSPVDHWTAIASSADGVNLAAVVKGGWIWTSSDYGASWANQIGAGTLNWLAIASSASGSKIAAVDSGNDIWTGTRDIVIASGAPIFNKLRIDGAGTKVLGEDLTVNEMLRFDTGVFDSVGHTINTGYIDIHGGTFSPGSSVINLSGTTSFTLYNFVGGTITGNTAPVYLTGGSSANLSNGNPIFYSLTSSGSGTFSLLEDLNITTNLNILNGTLDTTGSNYTVNAENVLIDGAGTFTTNASNIYLSGTRGTLMTTSNGGKLNADTSTVISTGDNSAGPGILWTKQTNAGIHNWSSTASSSDGKKLVAVDYGGYIYTSTDSGVDWVARTGPGLRSWLSVTSSADGIKLAAVDNGGYIYTSTDSGVSWIQQTNSGMQNWYAITSSADGTKLAAAVSGYYIYTSIDSGVNWTAQSTPKVNWMSLTSSADGVYLAGVEYGGSIYTSNDSGVNWYQYTGYTGKNWTSITSSTDGKNLVAVASGEYIYTSIDSGANWTQQSYVGNWQSVSSSMDGKNLVATEYGGYVWVSFDSGITWDSQSSWGWWGYWQSVALSADGTKIIAVEVGSNIWTGLSSDIKIASGGTPFYNLKIDSPGVKTTSEELFVGNELTINSGTLETTFLSIPYQINAGNIIVSGGVFNVGTSLVNLTGTSGILYNFSSGTADLSASSVTLSGGGNATISNGGPTFGNLLISGAGTKTIVESLVVWGSLVIGNGELYNTGYEIYTGNLNVSGGIFTPGSSPIYLTGTSGTLYTFGGGTITGNTAPVYVTGSGTTILNSGNPIIYSLLLSGSGTSTLGGTLTVSNATTISGGILSASNYTFNTKNIVVNGGTFSPNSSTINLTGTSGTLYTLSSGSVSSNNATINLTGAGNATVASGNPTIYNLTSSSTGTKSLGSTLNMTGALTITAGTFDTGSNYAVNTGSVLINGGTFNANNSTINLLGGASILFTKSSGTFNAGGSTVNIINSQNIWTQQLNSGIRSWISVASSSDGTKLAAINFGGYIYTSVDSGANWTQQTNSGTHAWYSIASSSDGTKLVAVDSGGYIYTSVNSGANWTQQTNSGVHGWRGVTSSSDGTKLAAIYYGGYIYTSVNSGANWTQQTNSGVHGWNSIASSSDGTKLVAVDTGGYIYTSVNSGANWTQQTNSGVHNWYSIASSSDGTKLVAVDSGGYIYTSVNSGANWTQQTNSGVHGWRGVTSSSDGTKLAAVDMNNDGYVYTSLDAGVNWTQQINSGAHSWYSVTSSSDGDKLAATNDVSIGGYISTSLKGSVVASGNPSFNNLTINGGGVSLGEALTVSNSLSVTSGTLSTANYNISASSLTMNGGTFIPGSSTVALSGTGTVFNYSSGTFTPGTSTLKLTNASASAKTFAGGGQTYGNIWLSGAGSGAYTITGSNTFANFKDDNTTSGAVVNFTAGTTTTVDTWTVVGTVGNLITMQSTAAGNAWNLSDGTGVNSSDYISLKDSNATGGALYFAGSHSTNVSGNTGWSFTDPPCIGMITGNWNTGSNWGGTCTGAGGIPGTGDNVLISSGVVMTMDAASAALGNITVNGTLNTSGTNYALSGQTITIGSSGTLNANGSTITLSGTTSTLFTLTAGGTFTAGTSTVVMNSDANVTLTSGTLTGSNSFYNVTLSPTISASRAYVFGAGAVNIGNNLLENTAATGTYLLTVNLGAGGLTVAGTTTIQKNGANTPTSLLTTTGSNYAFTTGYLVISTGGTFTPNGSNVNITGTTGTLITNTGTWTAQTGGTTTLSGNGSAIISSAPLTFYNLTSTGTGTKTTGASFSTDFSHILSVSGGTFALGTSSNLVIGGSCSTNNPIATPTGGGAISAGTGSTVYYNCTNFPGDLIIESSVTYYNLVLQTQSISKKLKPNGTLNGNVAGVLNITSGTLDTTSANNYGINFGSINIGNYASAGFTANNSAITLSGTSGTLFTKGASGTFTQGTSTVVLSGNGNATINSGSPTFYNLTSSGTGVKTLGAAITLASSGTLSITNGTFDPSTYLITGSGSNTLSVGASGTIRVGASTFAGNYSAGFTTKTFTAGSTVDYFLGGTQTVDRNLSYSNLSISTSGTKALEGGTSVGGNLSVNAGTLDLFTGSLTVTGVTSVSGTLNDSSSTGTNIFVGMVTVNNGGTWTSTGNSAYTIRGGLTVNTTSTFTSGSGVYTFDTNAQNIGGTQTYTITNITNNITTGNGLTFTGAQPTVTTLTQGTSAMLTFSGTVPTITTLTATASPNTVQFTSTSGAQTIKGTTYHHLIINKSGQTAAFDGATILNGNLTITAGTLQPPTFNFTINGTTSISGTLSVPSNGGTYIFIGMVTVNSGGTWTVTNDSPFTFRGGLTVNTGATFSSGAGAYTFDTNAQTIGGTATYSITNITNNITTGSGLTFSGAQPSVGTLTQGSNSVLTFSGTIPTITTLTATASPNTVQYTGSSQTIKATIYHHLIINGSGIDPLGGATTANGTVTITAGTLDTTAANSYALNAANILINGGTLTANNSNITLNGASGVLFSKSSGTFNAGGSTATFGGTTSTENPLQSKNPSNTLGGGSDYNMGYKFTPNVNGTITQLGVRVNATTRTVRLYAMDGTVLATTTVNPNANVWTYANITPVNVTAGTSYVVATRNGAGNAYYYSNTLSMPTTSGNITINDSRYSSATNNIPTSIDGNMYGMADVTFSPSTNATLVSGTPSFYKVVINGTGGTFNLGETLTTTNALIVTAGTLNTANNIVNAANILLNGAGGTFTPGSSTINLSGTSGTLFAFSAGTFTSNTASFNITGTSGTPTLASGTPIFYNLTINGSGGAPVLGEALTVSGNLYINGGTLTTANNTISAGTLNIGGGTITAGSSIITITGTGTVVNYTSGTYTAGTSTIKITDTSATGKTFAGGGQTYGTLWLTGGGTGVYTISGSNTFNTFKMDDNTVAHTVNFTAGTTTTVTTWTVSGVSGKLITMQSTSVGSAWNLSKASGQASSDYLSLKDSHALGGAAFFAGANSTNVSGNTGWIFTGPTCVATTTGNWNTGSNWLNCTGVGGVPGTNDPITINSGVTITMDVASPTLGNITINGTLNTSATNYALSGTTLSLASTGVLTANGSIISLSGTTGVPIIYATGGTFNAGTSTITLTGNYSSGNSIIESALTYYNLTLNNASETWVPNGTLNGSSSGALTVTAGTFDTTSANSYGVNFGYFLNNGGTTYFNNSTFTLSGTTGTVYNSSSSYLGTSTFIISGNGDVVIGGSGAYNLTISGTGSKTFNNVQNINGDLSVTAGILQIGLFNFNVTGTTTVSTAGTISDNNVAGTNVFTGAVIINSGGTWTVTNDSPFTFRGGLTVNTGATFSSGAGAYTFDTNAQTIGGTATYSITNITNNITTGSGLTFSGAQPSVGTLTQGSNSVLTFSGTIPTITTLTATASLNTVQYIGSGQTVKATTYHHLTIDGAGTKTLGGATTANGTLRINAGTLDTNSANNYTLGAANLMIQGGTLLLNNSTMNLSGTTGALFTKSSGTFTAGGSTVVLTGTSGTPTVASGTPSFYNLTKNGAGGAPVLGETLTVTNALTITAGTLTTVNNTVNTGRITINGGTFTPGSSTINLTGTSGTLFTFSSGTFTSNTAPVNLTGNGSATINSGTVNFYTLASSGTGTKTVGGNLTTSGAFTVNAGTFELSAYNITIGGTISVSGTLNDSSSTGTNIFVGMVTVNNGGTWTSTGNSAYTIRGGLTVNTTSTFTSGSGVYTFDTNAQNIGGTQTYTITNITNNITTGNGLTFSGASPTVGTLTQGSNAILTFSGAMPTITTLTATASNNVVNYNSSGAQTIIPTTYRNLRVIGGGTATLGGTTIASGTLMISSGTFDTSSTNSYTLTTGQVFINGGIFNANNSTINIASTFGTNLINSGTFNAGGSTVVITGTSGTPPVASGTPSFYNLTINGVGGTPVLGETLTVTKTLRISAGTLSTADNTINTPALVIDGGTFTPGSSTINLSGTSGTLFTLSSGVLTSNTVTTNITGTAGTPTLASGTPIFYNLNINGVGGAPVLSEELAVSGNLYVNAGTLTTVNNTISAGTLNIAGGIFTPGSSVIKLYGTGTVFNYTSGTYNAGTSTIKIQDATAATKTFAGGGQTYGNIWITGAGTGAYTITGSNTFADFKDDNTVAHTVNFTAGTTTTVSTWTVSGTAGNLITLQSTSLGNFWNLNDVGGTNNSNYLILKDSHAGGGASWYPGSGTTDGGGNTGWIFASLTFGMSSNLADLGPLTTSASRYATSGSGSGGSATEVEAQNFTVTAASPGGYSVSVIGASLTNINGGHVLTPIGGTNTAPNPGNEQFGLRMTATGGSGTVNSPYNASGFAYAANSSTASQVCSATIGDNATTTYSVRYVANIAPITSAGTYHSDLIYIVTGNF